MSEQDLRVLSEIERGLELMGFERRRRRSEHSLLLAACGMVVGAVLIGIGLCVTAAVGTVAAVGGFGLIVWASYHISVRTQRALIARSGRRATWHHNRA